MQPERCATTLRATLLAISFIVCAMPALAQEALVLDTVTVTATRAERPVSDIPQTMQVITQDEIASEMRLTSDPAAVLSKVIPGYSVSNDTISGASETFRGRDLLVMIDGVPLNTPLRDVSRIVSMIDLNSVDRIEVLAGASSLYGSGATGGTVNFITKKPTSGKPQITVNTSLKAFTQNIGNSLRPETSVSVTGKADSGVDYVIVGTGRMANKTYDGAGRELPSDGMLGQGGGDRLLSGNGLAKLGYDFAGNKRFEVSANWIYLDQSPDYMTVYSPPYATPNFSAPYQGASVLEDTKSFSARYLDGDFALGDLKVVGFYNDVKKRFNYSTFDINANYLVYYSGNLGTPTSPYNQTVLLSKRGGVNTTIDTSLDRLWRGATFTWGADIINERTSQELTNGQDVFNPMSQTSYAAFGQLQVPLTERLTVRGGARYEYLKLSVDDFVRPAAFLGFTGIGYAVLPNLPVTGGNFNYDAPTFNIGATFKITRGSEIYGGFNQGFALPDVGAFTRRAGASGTAQILYYGCFLGAGPLPAINYTCNKNLTASYANIGPEAQIVNNYELGLRGTEGRLKYNLAGFVSTSDKGVSFDAATNTITQQKEIVYGVEFSGAYKVTSQLTLGGLFRYQEGRYDSDKDGSIDSYLPNNRIGAPYRGTIYGDYAFDNGVTLRLEGEGFSGRNKAINTTGTTYELKPAAIMNAALSAPWNGATVYAGINNIFDTAYENPTATSVRNLPVYAWGRTVTVGYRKTF
jgi:iron complex outermembrane receptor protein